MKKKQIKEQTAQSRYFIQKESLFKNKKKILSFYKEGITINTFEENEKEEILYEDILSVTSERQSKDFSINLKDSRLNDKEGQSSNIITYSTTNLLIKSHILSDFIKNQEIYFKTISQINQNSQLNKDTQSNQPSTQLNSSNTNQQQLQSNVNLKYSFFLFLNESLFSNFTPSKETNKIIFSKPNITNSFLIDVVLLINRSNLEWTTTNEALLVGSNTGSKNQIETKLKYIDILSLTLINGYIIKIETINYIDFYLVPKSLEVINDVLMSIQEKSKTEIQYDIQLNIYENHQLYISSISNIQNTLSQIIKNNSFYYQFDIKRVMYYSNKSSILFCLDKEYFYEIGYEEGFFKKNSNVASSNQPNVQNISESNLLSLMDLSKCNRFVKIPISSILCIVAYSNVSSIDLFEIILNNNSRFLYKCEKKERNEIVGTLISLYESIHENECEQEINENKEINTKPFLLLNMKPRLESRILGFSNLNENDIEYDKYIIKKIINSYTLSSNDDNIPIATNANLTEKTIQKDVILEEAVLNRCFSKLHFRHEFNSNHHKNFFNEFYESLQKEIFKLEKIVNISLTGKNTGNTLNVINISSNVSNVVNTGNTNCANNQNQNVNENFKVNTLNKSSSYINLNVTNTETSKLNQTNLQQNQSIDKEKEKEKDKQIQINNQSTQQEEEMENKKTKLIYLINLYLIYSRNLLVSFNNEKLLSYLILFLKQINHQTLYYNGLSIIKELLPIINERENEIHKNEYLVLKKEEVAQKKWIISIHLDNGLLLKALLFKRIFEGNKPSLFWEEKEINYIYITYKVIKHLHLFTSSISNLISKASHIKEFSSYDFLYITTLLLKSNSIILKETAIETLLGLLSNLSYDQEFKLKQTILSETIIFFLILHIFICPSNQNLSYLSMKFLKIFVISHVEASNLLLNIFPKSLFYLGNTISKLKSKGNANSNNDNGMIMIEGNNFSRRVKNKEQAYHANANLINSKPNPINWLDHEWNTFFGNVNKNFFQIKIIWSNETRHELSLYLCSIIKNYLDASEDENLIKCMFLKNESEMTNELVDVKEVKETKDNKEVNINKIDINSFYFCMNYKELRKSESYSSLEKYHMVYKYYLKILIQEEQGLPCFIEEIEDPMKFWDKLIQELVITDISDYKKIEKILLIIKSLCLLYKDHSETIGVFKYYNHFLSLFSINNEKNEINEYIIQLILISLDINDREIKKQNIEMFIDSGFICNDIIFLFIDHLLFSNNKFLYKNSIDINEKDFYEEENAKFKWNFKFFNNFSGGGFLNLPCKINLNGEVIDICKDNKDYMKEYKDNIKDLNLLSLTPTQSHSQSQQPQSQAYYIIKESDFNRMNFLDNKNLILKHLQCDFIYDKVYNNFTYYNYIDDSFNKGDKSIKCMTYIVRIMKILLKRYKIVSDSLSKIYYPIPRIKLSFMKKENFFKIILILLINNNNLILETLDLLLNFLNDPIIFKEIAHIINLPHILVFYLIKFRSKSIMKYIDKLNYYNNIFFNKEAKDYKDNQLPVIENNKNSLGFININNSKLLSIDEKLYLKLYPETNQILIRYFPINLLYFYRKTNLDELINMLFKYSQSDDFGNIPHSKFLVQWNRTNLKSLIETLVSDMRKYIAGELAKTLVKVGGNASSNTNEGNQYYIGMSKFPPYKFSLFEFSSDFKMRYDSDMKIKILIYYIKEIETLSISTTKNEEGIGNVVNTNNTNNNFNSLQINQISNTSLIMEITQNLIVNIEDSHINICSELIIYKITELMIKIEGGINEKDKPLLEISSYLSFYKLITMKNFRIINEESLVFQKLIDIIEKVNLIKSSQFTYINTYSIQILKFICDSIVISYNNIESYFDLKNNFIKIRLLSRCVIWFIDNIEQIINLEIDYQFILKLIKSLYKIYSEYIKRHCSNESGFIDDAELVYLLKSIKNKLVSYLNQTLIKTEGFDIINANVNINTITQNLSSPIESIQNNEKNENIKIKSFFKNINTNMSLIIESLLILINNCLSYTKPKSLEDIIINDNNLEIYLKIILLNSNQSSYKLNKPILDLLHTLSLKSESSQIYLLTKFNIQKLFNRLIDLLEIIDLQLIFRILMNLSKQVNTYEKISLSVFVFIIKKIIKTKNNEYDSQNSNINHMINKSSVDISINIRVEGLKLIKNYLKIEKFKNSLKNIIEMYLPMKIYENIFSNDITSDSLTWIDSFFEYPDLIWNNDSRDKTISLIERDCEFIIDNEDDIINFPQNLFEFKLDHNRHFFYEIPHEYIIDGIYIRVYNTNPSYNINKPIILFMKNIYNSFIGNYIIYGESSYVLSMLNTDKTDKINCISQSSLINIKSTYYYRSILSLSALTLILEQILMNDFNENLIVSSPELLLKINENLLKNNDEADLLSFIQKTIDNKKLLSEEFLRSIIDFSCVLLKDNPFNINDDVTKILFLQLIYLLSSIKEFSYLFEGIDLVNIIKKGIKEREYIINEKKNEKVKDLEILYYILIIYKLIGYETSYIPIFLTEIFNDLFNSVVMISIEINENCLYKNNEEIKINGQIDQTGKSFGIIMLSFIKLITKVSNDSQYGEGMINLLKSDKDKYCIIYNHILSDKSHYINGYNSLWRNSPENKDQVEYIYKENHINVFIDNEEFLSRGKMYNIQYKLPYFPCLSKEKLDCEEIEDNILNELGKIISHFEDIKKNEFLIESYKSK